MATKPTYEELQLRVKELELKLRDSKQTKEILHEAQDIRQLLNFAPFGVYLIDLSGKIIACNENGAERLGKTIETAIRTLLRDYFPAKVSENRRLKGMEAIQLRKAVVFEDEAEGRWYRNSIFPIFDEEGRPVRLAIYGSDVTEYKDALDALEKSEEKYKQLSDSLPQVVFETDESGNIIFANRVAFDLFGYTRDDYEKGLSALQMLIPEDRERAASNIQKALRGEKFGGTEYTALMKDGRTYPVMLYSNPVVREGNAVGLRGIIVDLTDVKRAEKALRESEEKYRRIYENSVVGFFESTPDGRFLHVNPALAKMLRYESPEDLVSSVLDIASRTYVNPKDRSRYHKALKANGYVEDFQFKARCKDGSEVWLSDSSRAYFDGDGEVIRYEGIVVDITERKRAEEALRHSREEYRSLYEKSRQEYELYHSILHTSADAIVSYDMEGKVQYVNPSFTDIFGWTLEELKGKWVPFLPDSEREATLEGIKVIVEYGKPIRGFKTKRYTKDGRTVSVSISGSRYNDHSGNPAGMLVILRDTSQEKKLEAQLQRAQKMEALGLLAGGVAHDLNNILSGIVSYPELILMDLPEGSPLRKPMKTIHESGMRAAGVVSDLLTIARGVATGKETLNLNSIVNEYLGSPEYQKLEEMHPVVNLRTDLDCHLLNMRGSPIHLKKTLMNLVTNASEAIESGGTVTISTLNLYLDEPLKGYDDVRTGEYVVLSVADNGHGISSKDMDRVFEPFYTKKVMGRSGTGLGLTVVWNTVQDHNGYVNVVTGEQGTTFELYFPVTRDEIAEEKEPVGLEEYMGHGEKILVVDDEETQREIAAGILMKLGYRAEAVPSGEAAIAYVKEHPVDLIVLDMVMPKGINGRETYEEILKVRPEQKAVIASGYAKTKEVEAAQKLGAGKYVKKPYTLEKIGIAVKRELGK